MTTQLKDPANPTDEELEAIEEAAWRASGYTSDSWDEAGRPGIQEQALYQAGRASMAGEVAELRAERDDLRAQVQDYETVGVEWCSREDRRGFDVYKARTEKAEAELVKERTRLEAGYRAAADDWGRQVTELQDELARLRADSFAAAADLLREMARIGDTPVRDITEAEKMAYVAFPLYDGDGFNASDAARQVADWLSSQSLQPAKSLEQAVERIKRATPEETVAVSVRAGIHNPDGTLTERYGGEPQPADPCAGIRSVAAQVATPQREPPYETAPRLEKGVRYRVVEAHAPHSRSPREGESFVATGDENLWRVHPWNEGWYALWTGSGLHRVVRVEPEKCERCGGDGKDPEACQGLAPNCRRCNGTGEKKPKCERCEGKGRVHRDVDWLDECPDCNGTGEKGGV